MASGLTAFFAKYYDAEAAGRYPYAVRSCGYSHCGAGTDFGEVLKRHPKDHRFAKKKGRVLNTVTIIHVTRGGGFFRSEVSEEIKVDPDA